MKRLCADLHIHTCLSPCGDLTMDPPRVVAEALACGLDLVAICDHNTTGNCGAVISAARGTGLVVLPGCEICTSEEIHLLALFGDLATARAAQCYLDSHLEGENNPDVFGYQIEADARGDFTGECTRFLLGALDQGVTEVVQTVKALGGLVLCAHIDRPSFSVISQLGFMPPDLFPDGVEITLPGLKEGRMKDQAAGYPVVTSSDAHFPRDVGRWATFFEMDHASFDELAMALHGECGRSIAGYHERDDACFSMGAV